MKKILVIYYSQSGQLDRIIDNFLIPFDQDLIEKVKVYPLKPFPWPWTGSQFFDAMPESVLEEGIELQPLNFSSVYYDLIIVGYQPWYLSTSIPATALFKNQKFLVLLKNKPVITIIGSRNMWLNSQEIIKEHIFNAGGNLVANIPLIDRHNNIISAYSILQWMLTGVKKCYHGIFPWPGVSEKDIGEADIFGKIVNDAFLKNSYENIQQKILATGRIKIGTDILFIELRAKKIFLKFAHLIKRRGTTAKKRASYVRFFKYYLFIALFIVAPIVLLFYTIFFRPFMSRSIKRKKQYFCGVKRKVKKDE